MEEIINETAGNFIHDIIDEELREGVNPKVQTRFPPEPNGYLHIGHCKALTIDFGTAEKFGGLCNLRMDDTNPLKESIEYENAIIESLKWAGFKWSRICYASDYYEKMYGNRV